MDFNADELAALDSRTQRIGVFFRLETDPIVRIWLGIGAIEPGVNVFDPAGARYLGFGQMRNVPNFKQLINGAAERVEFTLSGVSGKVQEIAAAGDAQDVKGKALAVGFAIMGQDWKLLGPVRWCANYVADFLGIDNPAVDNPEADPIRTIRLSCGTTFTGRRRPKFSYFTNRDQQARSPGDRFCERVQIYATGFSKTWPTFPDP
ncbi:MULTISPECIES: hypothetical protein [unclassified Bradyrhizobium]